MSKLTYFKLRADHPRYHETLARLGDDRLGVNVSIDGKFAWVKAPSDSDVPDEVLVDSAPMDQANRVRAETASEAWTGPRDYLMNRRR